MWKLRNKFMHEMSKKITANQNTEKVDFIKLAFDAKKKEI